MEVLPMVLFPIGDNGFGLAELIQHDDELAPLDLLNLAGEQLAHLGGEFLTDARPLTLTNPLDDPLLGGLHCKAAELYETDLFLQHIADSEVRIFVLRLVQRYLPAGVFNGRDDLSKPNDLDGPLELVHT